VFDERVLEEIERAVTAMPGANAVLLDELAQTRARLIATVEASPTRSAAAPRRACTRRPE
jgi:hypothetical protein